MGFLQQLKSFIYSVVVIAMLLFVFQGALARPVFDESGGRLRSSELFAMLPKGVPVPPAGPSPGIN